MSVEAQFWIGVILASPGVYMASKLAFDYLLDTFFADDIVEISVEFEDGTTKTEVLHLSKSDDLAQILKAIRSNRAVASKSGGV